MNTISKISLSDIIAALALVASLVALGWNIIRDLIVDRVKLDIQASVGDLLPVQGIPTRAVFRDADSEFKPQHPKVAFSITNVGRRPMVVTKIHGEYKKPENGKPLWIFIARDLPKKLSPYETAMEIGNEPGLLQSIKSRNIKNINIRDTKGKDWSLSRKAMKNLERTAEIS